MERFQRTTSLIQEILAMIIAQILGTNDAVEIGLEEFLDEVDYWLAYS